MARSSVIGSEIGPAGFSDSAATGMLHGKMRGGGFRKTLAGDRGEKPPGRFIIRRCTRFVKRHPVGDLVKSRPGRVGQ
jgi:hypothetical protein